MESINTLNLELGRHKYRVLLVCQKGSVSSQLRNGLGRLGFKDIFSCGNYEQGLDYIADKEFHLVFFDAYDENQSSDGVNEEVFIEKALEKQEGSILVAVSTLPTAESIFKVIKTGARGYLIPPFSPESVEAVVVQAAEGPKIDRAVLEAADRNEALSILILDGLARVTNYMTKMRDEKFDQNEDAESCKRNLEQTSVILAQWVQAARKLAEDGENALVQRMVEVAVNRVRGQTRLGSARQKLLHTRGKRPEA